MIETSLISARFVHYVALVLLFGSWAYAGFSGADATLSRRFARLIVGSASLVLIGSAAVLAATVAGLGGGYETLAEASLWATIITETDFGKVWSVRLALSLLAIAAALAWARWHGPRVGLLGIVIAGALASTTAWTGHAAIEGGLAGQLHRWADALHMIAAVTWIGAFAPLLWLLASRDNGREVAQRLARFHAVGISAVVTLLITGAVNSYFLVGTPEALATTPYGRLLTLKLALFAGMIGLAARNKLRLTPALAKAITSGTDPSERIADLRRSIGGELALGVIVLAIVAVLGAIEPAASV